MLVIAGQCKTNYTACCSLNLPSLKRSLGFGQCFPGFPYPCSCTWHPQHGLFFALWEGSEQPLIPVPCAAVWPSGQSQTPGWSVAWLPYNLSSDLKNWFWNAPATCSAREQRGDCGWTWLVSYSAEEAECCSSLCAEPPNQPFPCPLGTWRTVMFKEL